MTAMEEYISEEQDYNKMHTQYSSNCQKLN